MWNERLGMNTVVNYNTIISHILYVVGQREWQKLEWKVVSRTPKKDLKRNAANIEKQEEKKHQKQLINLF